jgi:hypothetical protein
VVRVCAGDRIAMAIQKKKRMKEVFATVNFRTVPSPTNKE